MAYPQLTFPKSKINPDSFIGRKRKTIFENTIPYQLQVLKDTGCYDAFKLKWKDSYTPKPEEWPIPRDFHVFWDSDIGKWIEGACYSLHDHKNPAVENAVHELVEMIRGAQQDDGYINIHFTVVEPEKRFTNLRDMHELYNAGHLIEAAIAHHDLFKNTRFLEPMLKYVRLLCDTFGPGKDQKHGYPGHPEIELALLRLHSVTGDLKHLALGQYFIDERGNLSGVDGKHFYDWEAEKRGERLFERPTYFPVRQYYQYQQAHKPVIEQETIEGHSVRAVYLLTGAADLQRKRGEGVAKGELDYQKALGRLWNNMVEKKMYLTGGIGAIELGEGFGIDYFLPQSTDEGGCYAETCAAIGAMMLAQRLLQLNLNGKYADVMELCFYNAVLGGMSCDGKKFAYTNQLASCDASPSARKEWFSCACCPPNVSRLLGSIGGYLWSYDHDKHSNTLQIAVNMFGSAVLSCDIIDGETFQLTQTSNWPWEGEMKFSLEAPGALSTIIAVRIPSWASNWKITPKPPTLDLSNGYLHLPAVYLRANPNFVLTIPMTTRFISPHPFTNQDIVALARGPLVYCVEDKDNPWVQDHFKTLLFDPTKAIISEKRTTDETTGETYISLVANGPACSFLDTSSDGGPGLSFNSVTVDATRKVEELIFVPFYYRASQEGRGQMRVGLRRKW